MEAVMPPAVEPPSADQLIVVHNLHHPQAWQPLPGFVDEYVDRRSPLGNPFKMGADGHDEAYRGAVCDAYEAFHDAPPGVKAADVAEALGLSVSHDFRRADAAERREQEMRRLGRLLDQGKRLRLKCWCAPKRCHAHSIARWLLRCHGVGGPTPSLTHFTRLSRQHVMHRDCLPLTRVSRFFFQYLAVVNEHTVRRL